MSMNCRHGWSIVAHVHSTCVHTDRPVKAGVTLRHARARSCVARATKPSRGARFPFVLPPIPLLSPLNWYYATNRVE